jgi:hypothetical protein
VSSKDHASALLRLAAVVTAATLGALIGIGHRLGDARLPLASIGAVVLRRTASATSADLVGLGVVLCVLAGLLWSALFTWLVRVHTWQPLVAAVAVAVIAHTLSWIVAWWTGTGLATLLPLGDRIVLAVVLAGALVVGTRFAFPASRSA